MILERLGDGGVAERAADLALDASFPSDEVHPAGYLKAGVVVLGMEDAAEVCKHERVQRGRGTKQRQQYG